MQTLLLALACTLATVGGKLPSAREFSAHSECRSAACPGLASRIVIQAWHAGGATWARAAVATLKAHCSFADLVVASQPSIIEKLPPARSCTIALASTGMGFQVPYSKVFALSPSQLRYVHIIREPFELVVATVMHHGHRGLECGGGGGNDRSSAIATLCPRLAARVSSASQVKYVTELYLKEKLPAMLASHVAITNRPGGGCLELRYEALVGGGDVLAHKAALKELLSFLGIPAEATSGCPLDRAADVLSQHFKLLGPGLGSIHRRSKGVVDLDGTRRQRRHRRRWLASNGEEDMEDPNKLPPASQRATRTTKIKSPAPSSGAVVAGAVNESESLRRRQLAAMRIDSHRENFGGNLWAAAAQQAPVTKANRPSSPWGSSSDGAVLGGFAPIGSGNTMSQSFGKGDSSSSSSPWLGSLNRGHGASPSLPGSAVFTVGGGSTTSGSDSGSSGRRNRHNHRSSLRGDVFATEPGLHGELSVNAAAARALRRRDAALERHLFQEVYALPTPLCPRLANFTFLLGYASSLPAAEGRCTWQSPLLDLGGQSASSLAAPHEALDVSGTGA